MPEGLDESGGIPTLLGRDAPQNARTRLTRRKEEPLSSWLGVATSISAGENDHD